MKNLFRTGMLLLVALMTVQIHAKEVSVKWFKVISTGDTAPSGLPIADIQQPGVASDGQFALRIKDIVSTGFVIAGVQGNLRTVVRTGGPVPGNAEDANEVYLLPAEHVEIQHGKIYLQVQPDTGTFREMQIVANSDGTNPSVVAQEGESPIPDIYPEMTLTGLESNTGFSFDGSRIVGEWIGENGLKAIVLVENGRATKLIDTNDKPPFGSNWAFPDSPHADRNGPGIALRMDIDDNTQLVLIGPHSVSLIASPGDKVLGARGKIEDIRLDVAIDRGNVVFGYETPKGKANGLAIYDGSSEDLLNIIEAGITLAPRGGVFSDVSNVGISDGRIFFLADLEGSDANQVFAASHDSLTTELLRSGDILDDKEISFMDFRREGVSGNFVGLEIGFSDGSKSAYLGAIMDDSNCYVVNSAKDRFVTYCLQN